MLAESNYSAFWHYSIIYLYIYYLIHRFFIKKGVCDCFLNTNLHFYSELDDILQTWPLKQEVVIFVIWLILIILLSKSDENCCLHQIWKKYPNLIVVCIRFKKKPNLIVVHISFRKKTLISLYKAFSKCAILGPRWMRQHE